MKNKLPEYRPTRRQVATSIGILVLAAAGFSFNAIDTTPEMDNNQTINNTDNVTDVNSTENLTGLNQSDSNQTQDLPDNLTQSEAGNNTNTS